MKRYGNQSLGELGGMLRSGAVSCLELTRSTLHDIGLRNDWLNAFVRITKKRAIAEAIGLDRELEKGIDRGPLHGIPYAIKDLFDVKGYPNGGGLSGSGNRVAGDDAGLVRKLKEAGAILVGQTHTSPLAATILGINHTCGTPRNPWSEKHYLPGGSSSGSAVAVAAGMVPFAIGTDTGGSVRVPAALCGIVGFRPGNTHCMSLEGCRPLAPTLDSAGLLCRSAADAKLIYQILGSDTHLEAVAPAQFRVLSVTNVFADQANAEIDAAVHDAASQLKSLGIAVDSAEIPEIDVIRSLMNKASIIAAEAYALYSGIVDDPRSDWVLHWIRKAKNYDPNDINGLRQQYSSLAAALKNRIKDYDVVIAPAVPVSAMPFADADNPDSHGELSALLSRNTMIGNLAGWSGITVPYAVLSDGLPCGVMLFSDPDKEGRALMLAQLIEGFSPFKHEQRRPPYAFSRHGNAKTDQVTSNYTDNFL